MPNQFQNAVAWVTLAQVVLVGALGTGLHGLFGCQHGPFDCRADASCVVACGSAGADTATGCHDCAFCRRQAASQDNAATDDSVATVASCDAFASCCGCVVCDLLEQYHSATPFVLDRLSIELVACDATVQLQNAVVSAATRLALSRGPPTA